MHLGSHWIKIIKPGWISASVYKMYDTFIENEAVIHLTHFPFHYIFMPLLCVYHYILISLSNPCLEFPVFYSEADPLVTWSRERWWRADATYAAMAVKVQWCNLYIYGLDCSNSSALAMELLQFCTKPSI